MVSKRFVILTSSVMLLAYVGYGVVILSIGNLTASANFGDAFGAISGLLNGAGLIAAVVALLLQQNELQETRKEVQVTLEAQKRQAAEATRAADAHEQSVRATLLLANVQGRAALLAYYDSLRSADIAQMDTLERELRNLNAAEPPNRRFALEAQIRAIRENLPALNKAALKYEQALSAVLKDSGYTA